MSQLPGRRFELTQEARGLLDALLEEEGVADCPSRKIHRRKETGPVPLSYAQQRLWFLDQLQTGIPAFNSAKAVRLRGLLNVAALERSLNEIVQRHESLRTTFRAEAGKPVQILAPILRITVPVVEPGTPAGCEREEQVLELAQEAVRQPFDLERGPLLRATLLRLDDEEHVLLVVVHHIVYDGWSMAVLMRELGTLYEAFSSSKPSPLPELPLRLLFEMPTVAGLAETVTMDMAAGAGHEELVGLLAELAGLAEPKVQS